MMNTYVNITGKLNDGLVALYLDIDKHASELGISYLVVGAMARDLILFYGYDAKIERGTRDVDFGINVENWEQFTALQNKLIEAGFEQDKVKVHKFTRTDDEGLPWEIDIVPFGGIVDENHNIAWPPKQDFVMNVMGFNEAHNSALQVEINKDPQLIIPVASPAGIGVLKLIAWLDRAPELRKKDATDIKYLIDTYSKIPEILNSLYDDEYMETHDYDVLKASAMKFGRDMNEISSPEIKDFLKIMIFDKSEVIERLALEMRGDNLSALDECIECLGIVTQELQV